MERFSCPRCGNEDPRYIGHKHGVPYCRRCISFQGTIVEDQPKPRKEVVLSLDYPLSSTQKDLSEKIVANFKAGIDSLVYAVTGSGKTEISYGVIAYAMANGMNVGFALPRRDVVIELFFRLRDAFPRNKIVAVYGQHTSCLTGDCVILTTHQLFRYPDYFDLLVLDEIDAFPFKGNETLIALFKRSLRGHCLMMSATPSKAVVAEFKKPGHDMLTLHTRFHRRPIPVPEMRIAPFFLQYFVIISKLRDFLKQNKPCFVFVPSVDLSVSLGRFLSRFFPGGNYVSSKREGRAEIIADFKKGKYRYLVTTAVLERGVTVADLQVIVFHADDPIYDAAALIQIAGRAGRKAKAPTGEVVFIANKESEGMKRAKREIEFCNSFL